MQSVSLPKLQGSDTEAIYCGAPTKKSWTWCTPERSRKRRERSGDDLSGEHRKNSGAARHGVLTGGPQKTGDRLDDVL